MRGRLLVWTLCLMALCKADSASTKRAIGSKSSSTLTAAITTTETEQPPVIPAKGDVIPEKDDSSPSLLGPWAIGGVIVGAVAAVAAAVVLVVTVNRRLKRSSNADSEKSQNGIHSRPIKYVHPGDNSWRGPTPFYEPISMPDTDSEVSQEEFDDDLTILEPPLKKTTRLGDSVSLRLPI